MFSEAWKNINKGVATQYTGPPFGELPFEEFMQLISDEKVIASTKAVLRHLFPTRNINPKLLLTGFMIADYRANVFVMNRSEIRIELRAAAFIMARNFEQVLTRLRDGRYALDGFDADFENFLVYFRLWDPDTVGRIQRAMLEMRRHGIPENNENFVYLRTALVQCGGEAALQQYVAMAGPSALQEI